MNGFEKSLSCPHERRKKTFLYPKAIICTCALESLDLTMQKVSLDILMIIWHNSYQIIYLFEKCEKNKVALAVKLSICFRAEPDNQYIHLYIPV